MRPLINVIVFSKNRACQAEALWRTFRCNIKASYKATVIYCATLEFTGGYAQIAAEGVPLLEQKDFRNDVLAAVGDAPLTMFLVDDILFKAPVEIEHVKKVLDAPGVLSFSLRLWKGVTSCYATGEATTPPDSKDSEDGHWEWRKQTGDWGYPGSLDGDVYRTDFIKPILQALGQFDDPNDLEAKLSHRLMGWRNAPHTMACFPEASCLVNIPANRVQHRFDNRHAGLSTPAELEQKFLDGWRISERTVADLSASTVHVELPYIWTRPDGKTPAIIIHRPERHDRDLYVNRLVDAPLFKAKVMDAIVAQPSYVACSLSHRAAVRMASEMGLESVLIFEDDTVLSDDFNERWPDIKKWLDARTDWGIFNGNPTYPWDWEKAIAAPEWEHRPLGIAHVKGVTANFTYIPRRTFDSIAGLTDDEVRAVGSMDVLYPQRFKIFTSLPFMSKQAAGYSDLENCAIDYVSAFAQAERWIWDRLPKASITFVTALFGLDELGRVKDTDHYVPLLRKLARTGITLVLFMDEKLRSEGAEFEAMPNVQVKYMRLEDTWTHQFLSAFPDLSLPQQRNTAKDTRSYLTLMNAKFDFLVMAMASNSASHFAWVDAGILDVARDCKLFAAALHGLQPASKCILCPGFWDKPTDIEALWSKISWRFAGGFFLGDAASLRGLYETYKQVFADEVSKRKALTWEINFLALIEAKYDKHLGWYKAVDHNESLVTMVPSKEAQEPFEEHLTIVTCLFDLGKRESSNSRPQDAEFYIRHGTAVLALDVNLIVFADPEIAARIPAAPRRKVVPCRLEDLPAWQDKDRIDQARKASAFPTNAKDTPVYAVFQRAKMQLLDRAMRMDTQATHFAWLDFGIAKAVSLDKAFFAFSNLPRKVKILQLGELRSVIDWNQISHCLAMGYIAGSVEYMQQFYRVFDAESKRLLAEGHAPHDETLLEFVVQKYPEVFELRRVSNYATMFTDYVPVGTSDLFQLANTHRDQGQIEKAVDLYQQRIDLGGPSEEVWAAYFGIAQCYINTNEEKFIKACLEAYNYMPTRAEPLYWLARIYRERGKNEVSALMSEVGSRIPHPPPGSLLVDSDIYNHGFKEEMSIVGFYSRSPERREAGYRACVALTTYQGDTTRTGARVNLVHYIKSAKELFSAEVRSITWQPDDGYAPMNPSVHVEKDRRLVLVRTVNYKVTESGQYPTVDGSGIIRTRNHIVEFDSDWSHIKSSLVEDKAGLPRNTFPVEGFEDCRLWKFEGNYYASATVRDLGDGRCEMSVLKYDAAWRIIDVDVIRDFCHEGTQKNWMPIAGKGPWFVYWCGPTVIVERTPAKVTVERYRSTPSVFLGDLRGGSQVIPFEAGWVCLVHEVTWAPVRFYFHRFVVMDKDFKIQAVSDPFYFHTKGIEFCAGLAQDGGRFVASFGVNDASAHLAFFDIEILKSRLKKRPGNG